MSQYEHLMPRWSDAFYAQQRTHDLWALGGIPARGYPWRWTLPTPKAADRFSPIYYLPEIDPQTMKATNRVKVARLA